MKKLSLIRLSAAITILTAGQFAFADGPIGYATLNGGTVGGAGGQVVYASTGTQINEALCNRANDDSPIIIYVSGTINHGNTEKRSGSCDTAGDRIQLKNISNVSLIGLGNGALLDEMGIQIRESSNIIIRNLRIRNVKKSGSPISNGGDAIGMEKDVRNIWIDHNTLEASGGEDDGYDALLDMKNNTQYVTVSYNRFYKSGRGGLMGSSDSDDRNTFVTFHHNWYDEIESRMPLLRHGTAHAFNNYYSNVSKSVMNPRIGGRIKAEHNHFYNVHNPIGTFYTNDMGYWEVKDNIFESVTWSSPGDTDQPAGPNPSSTATIFVPYSYTLDAVNCVKAIVTSAAGAGTGLATSDGSCSSDPTDPTNPTDPTPTDPTPTDPTDPTDPGEPGTNLTLNAGSDGSSKGTGSYGDVRDGDMATFWAPSSSDNEKRISVKWSSDTTINRVVIREASGYEGNITSWMLVNNDTGSVLRSGSSVGTINFDDVSLRKVNFIIESANGTPTVAEFETYYVD